MGVGGRRLMLEMLTAAARPPRGTRYQRITVAGVPVERVQTPSGTNGTLIYLHGGAYALGSARGYGGLVAHLGAAAGLTALIPDYSRAPEAQYPIALEEMIAVYSQLLKDGLDPKTTVIAGDSAGGGLTLALAMALRERRITLPTALGLICPWADLALDVEAMRPVLRDPLIPGTVQDILGRTLQFGLLVQQTLDGLAWELAASGKRYPNDSAIAIDDGHAWLT